MQQLLTLKPDSEFFTFLYLPSTSYDCEHAQFLYIPYLSTTSYDCEYGLPDYYADAFMSFPFQCHEGKHRWI